MSRARWPLVVFWSGPVIAMVLLVLALAEVEIPRAVWPAVAFMYVGAVWLAVTLSRVEAEDERTFADGFSDGDSVEVDCRLCGQFNRVPATRLRDRPMCGRCKTRLMPGRRIVICRMSRIEQPLRTELDAAWTDEARLWGRLADHLATKQRADEERRRATVN